MKKFLIILLVGMAFISSGQAIEVSGYNVSMIYSDSPVPALSNTCLGK